MAYQQQQPPGYQQAFQQQVIQTQGIPQQQVVQSQGDIVSGEQYRYALTNFRIAHEKVEQQRQQLEEQERQVAQLRARIALLEGSSEPQRHGKSGNTVDDFSIRNAAAQLDKLINRWAADIVRAPPVSMVELCQAIIADVGNGMELGQAEVTSMQLQCYLRHAMSETISEGIINCLIVTNSSEANVQLTRIHEHLFARDPTVACVWRRQTFSAAVETCTPDMSMGILFESVPELIRLLGGALPQGGNQSILESAYSFSRMLHGSTSGPGDAFYRAFVPELGSTLYPRQIELAKRCLRNERGEEDRVGATIFPGLVKVTRGPLLPNGQHAENIQTVVRRAQVICECAMLGPVAHAPLHMSGAMAPDQMMPPGMGMPPQPPMTPMSQMSNPGSPSPGLQHQSMPVQYMQHQQMQHQQLQHQQAQHQQSQHPVQNMQYMQHMQGPM